MSDFMHGLIFHFFTYIKIVDESNVQKLGSQILKNDTAYTFATVQWCNNFSRYTKNLLITHFASL